MVLQYPNIMNKPLKVAIVDDHQIFRQGLKMLFLNNDDFQVVVEAKTGEEFLELQKNMEIDIVLLDIAMPGIGGLEVLKILKEKNLEFKIIMLSANDDQKSILDAVKYGAMGFLDKNTTKEELFVALNEVCNNNSYFGKNISHIVFNNFAESLKNEKQKPNNVLSEREIEVVKLIASGLTSKEIAAKLFISSRTVEAHKNNILEKLGLKTSADIVKYAIKNNLIDL